MIGFIANFWGSKMNTKIFIMGAPNAGKSTFLGALWSSIHQREVPTALTLKKMMGDSQYLYRLEHKWLEAEQLERTVIGQEKEKLSVLLTNGIDDLEIEFPDLSGETFQNIYENREVSIELRDKISAADAILYFINVEDIYSPEFISELSQKHRQEDIDLDDMDLKERKPCVDDPTQVQVIDLIQIALEIRKKKTKIGIVFSAWDLVTTLEQNDVRGFLKNRMNMLWQYLESNKSKIETKVWGISAFGGKIDDAPKLLDIEDPINRIRIVNEQKETSCDLTSIILDILGD